MEPQRSTFLQEACGWERLRSWSRPAPPLPGPRTHAQQTPQHPDTPRTAPPRNLLLRTPPPAPLGLGQSRRRGEDEPGGRGEDEPGGRGEDEPGGRGEDEPGGRGEDEPGGRGEDEPGGRGEDEPGGRGPGAAFPKPKAQEARAAPLWSLAGGPSGRLADVNPGTRALRVRDPRTRATPLTWASRGAEREARAQPPERRPLGDSGAPAPRTCARTCRQRGAPRPAPPTPTRAHPTRAHPTRAHRHGADPGKAALPTPTVVAF
ncbi:translation initiation factor IF-2-like [Molossus molossus]|uniref:translation initiation factor IF-2-like n=1 Tax=Molossus molossus TaxID=27622 RepID=UPI001747C629|nr:translation initiation factor IF-2-like [Molossus molossus]